MTSSASAQQPDQHRNALMEFDTRMSNMVSELETTDTIFFFKHISKCMVKKVVSGQFAYVMEFPHSFLMQHGEKFSKDVTFVTTDSHQTWPIKLSVRNSKGALPRIRVFAYGLGGWKDFVNDNHIKVGDILIFKLLRKSHFEVVIGRSPGDQDNVHVDNAHQASPQAHQASPQAHQASPQAHQVSPQVNSSNNLPLLPKFRVTICRPDHPKHQENHFYLEKDLSLVVPTHFWEFHGHMLQYNELQLNGPIKTIPKVKVEKIYDEEVPKVRLEHFGWKAFLLANNLAIGDVLEFSLVANSSFKVVVVKRIEGQ